MDIPNKCSLILCPTPFLKPNPSHHHLSITHIHHPRMTVYQVDGSKMMDVRDVFAKIYKDRLHAAVDFDALDREVTLMLWTGRLL